MRPARQVVAAALPHLVPGRVLPPEDVAAAEDILDAAAAWAAGALPIGEAAAVGAMGFGVPPVFSAGRGRFVARWATPPDDPRLPCLAALIDALGERSGAPLDALGRTFTADEIAGIERRITHHGATSRVVFAASAAAVTARG